MAQPFKGNKAASWGLVNNYRYLSKKSMMLHATQDTRVRKKCQKKEIMANNSKRKGSDCHSEPCDVNKLIKKAKWSRPDQECDEKPNMENKIPEVFTSGASVSELNQHSLVSALRDRWEVDSGFSSETSPPASGRSSPCLSRCTTTVVALDCEMVGTGPGGRCSELARCSILDYHGNVLYDEYVKPCQTVTDFRTRWSGIRKHHLHNATPFDQARKEILSILEGKVVVGHSIYNDFEVLDIVHPTHMVRDTCTTRYLSRLAGLPRTRCPSLKLLANKLLNRTIQEERRGHCSVEDARATLDLYKLVEGEWEQELQKKLREDGAAPEPSFASSSHYMQDEYWPEDVTAGAAWFQTGQTTAASAANTE
ncbi:uncharacterized protein V6R79_012014 [Siganus canaliculatus]